MDAAGRLTGTLQRPDGSPLQGPLSLVRVETTAAGDVITVAGPLTVPITDGQVDVVLPPGLYRTTGIGTNTAAVIVTTGQTTRLGATVPPNTAGRPVELVQLPGGATDGQLLAWRDGQPVWVAAAESTGDGAALAAHIRSATPHPAYDDDLPDLALLFDNALL